MLLVRLVRLCDVTSSWNMLKTPQGLSQRSHKSTWTIKYACGIEAKESVRFFWVLTLNLLFFKHRYQVGLRQWISSVGLNLPRRTSTLSNDWVILDGTGTVSWNILNSPKSTLLPISQCYLSYWTRFRVAAEEHAAVYPHTFNPKYRGTSGPIDTSTPHHVHTIDLLFQHSLVNNSLNAVSDPYGGDVSLRVLIPSLCNQMEFVIRLQVLGWPLRVWPKLGRVLMLLPHII